MPTKLGQNFLKDATVLKRIVEVANISKDDTVLEIGPGTGVLTAELANSAKKVIAIEVDHSLIAPLIKRFSGDNTVEIIEGDILKINLPELVTRHQASDTGYKVVANIPYYITAPIIRLLLETAHPPKEMVLMVQKEVAERICAKPGEMSVLAVSVQYYANPEYLFTVPKSAFVPVPEVDSAVVKIATRTNSTENRYFTEQFFRVVKIGFSSKRKTLVNNLANGFKISRENVLALTQSCGLGPNARAQELSLSNWKNLARLINEPQTTR